MINFSAISNKSAIGKILRFFLRFVPKNTAVRILQGPLKGKKWFKNSGVNGYWLGSYELEDQKIFIENLKKSDIVFDIGANAGFYSLLAAELVGQNGKVFAFEPLDENFNYLKKHIEINNYKNIFPFKAAVSDKSGFAFFKKEESTAMSHLGADNSGDFKVETISIDDWVESGKLPIPNFLKIDVEGAEALVLKGAQSMLKKYRPAIFLSLHGEIARKECFAILNDCGYNLESINDFGASENSGVFIF